MATKGDNDVHHDLVAQAVSVILPVFVKSSQKAWLYTCEANFRVCKVTDSETKYWNAVAKLDVETQEELQEFLHGYHCKDLFEELKKKLGMCLNWQRSKRLINTWPCPPWGTRN